MHAEHIIALIGLGLGITLLTYIVALGRIRAQSFTQGKSAGLAEGNEHLVTLTIRREQERKDFKQSIALKDQTISSLQDQLSKTPRNALTKTDLQVLIDTVHTLAMAHRTWSSIKGTEPWQARAKAQLELLNGIAHRVLGETRNTDHASADLPGESA